MMMIFWCLGDRDSLSFSFSLKRKMRYSLSISPFHPVIDPLFPDRFKIEYMQPLIGSVSALIFPLTRFQAASFSKNLYYAAILWYIFFSNASFITYNFFINKDTYIYLKQLCFLMVFRLKKNFYNIFMITLMKVISNRIVLSMLYSSMSFLWFYTKRLIFL